jgi:hypothetical protein
MKLSPSALFRSIPNGDLLIARRGRAVRYTKRQRGKSMRTSPLIKYLQWTVAALLAALLLYVIFRAYLAPESLMGFANLLVC